MVSCAANGIVGFSARPLRMSSRLGLTISALGVLGAGYASYLQPFVPDRAVPGWAVPGWAFLGVGLQLSGTQPIMRGVVGTHPGRFCTETRAHPLYPLGLRELGGVGSGPR